MKTDENKIDLDLFVKTDDKYFYDGRELKVRDNSQGYKYVTIDKKGRRLHRLIALKYVPNPNDYPVVDHIDDDKTNNDISNLQWITHSENSKKAYDKNASMKKMHKHKSMNRVIISEKDGVKTEHKSLRECGKFLNRDVAAVFRCLDGEWTRCNGHKLYYEYK